MSRDTGQDFGIITLADIAMLDAVMGLRNVEYDFCHCGESIHYGYDGDPTHHRGMCEHCDSVRCDAFPGECER